MYEILKQIEQCSFTSYKLLCSKDKGIKMRESEDTKILKYCYCIR